MEDLISRDAVIESIKSWFDKIELNPDILIDSIITIPVVDAVEISAIKRYIKEQTIRLHFLEPNSEEYVFQDRLITALLIMFNELAYGERRKCN